MIEFIETAVTTFYMVAIASLMVAAFGLVAGGDREMCFGVALGSVVTIIASDFTLKWLTGG